MAETEEVLTLRCRTCGAEFPSKIQFTRANWEGGGTIQGVPMTCPDGHKANYDKKEYFFTASA